MKKTYDKETKNKCIQLRLQRRTVKSISEEYGLGVGTLKNWMDNYAKKPHAGGVSSFLCKFHFYFFSSRDTFLKFYLTLHS